MGSRASPSRGLVTSDTPIMIEDRIVLRQPPGVRHGDAGG